MFESGVGNSPEAALTFMTSRGVGARHPQTMSCGESSADIAGRSANNESGMGSSGSRRLRSHDLQNCNRNLGIPQGLCEVGASPADDLPAKFAELSPRHRLRMTGAHSVARHERQCGLRRIPYTTFEHVGCSYTCNHKRSLIDDEFRSVGPSVH